MRKVRCFASSPPPSPTFAADPTACLHAHLTSALASLSCAAEKDTLSLLGKGQLLKEFEERMSATTLKNEEWFPKWLHVIKRGNPDEKIAKATVKKKLAMDTSGGASGGKSAAHGQEAVIEKLQTALALLDEQRTRSAELVEQVAALEKRSFEKVAALKESFEEALERKLADFSKNMESSNDSKLKVELGKLGDTVASQVVSSLPTPRSSVTEGATATLPLSRVASSETPAATPRRSLSLSTFFYRSGRPAEQSATNSN